MSFPSPFGFFDFPKFPISGFLLNQGKKEWGLFGVQEQKNFAISMIPVTRRVRGDKFDEGSSDNGL
jgi:hypothetical protein